MSVDSRSRLVWALLGAFALGCGPKLALGSDVLWATDHEGGDVSVWSATPSGGVMLDDAGSTANVVTDHAHSGRYSLKLTDLAASDSDGPSVYRELIAPPDAYYSAWYYIPRAYVTRSQWTIEEFNSRAADDPKVIGHGHDVGVRALPDGQAVLYVFSHDSDYLQAPLADPPALVPIETWFQVEVLYRPRTDATGSLKVWLDDRLVYDLEDRRTAGTNDILWMPCNVAEDITPAPPELYIDDAAISLQRVTRSGQLFANP